jgi:hypothetical protein
MGGECSTYESEEDCIHILVLKSEGKSPLGRPRRKQEGNIKMNLTEIGLGINWIHLVQDRDQWSVFVNAVMNTHKMQEILE